MVRCTLALVLLALATPAHAELRTTDGDTPAHRYSSLTQEACEAALEDRGIPFKRDSAKGVMAAVRLTGALHGVLFRTNDRNEERRETSIWEIADCRLVLALDDFAKILAEHDIVEVRHYSLHRKAPDRWPDDKIGQQHIGGLAIDAAKFIKKDGSKLDVLDDFKGRIGARTCGPKARKVKSAAALELREIVCAAVDARLFNVVLTPDHNRAHRNHFHLEVTPGVTWMMVR